MAGRRVLADTSLFIEHLRAKNKEATHLYQLTKAAEVETCSIVAAEIFYGARKPLAESRAWEILRSFPIHPFTIKMAAGCCEIVRALQKKNRIQELRDIMIAATALELKLPIATLNGNHFGQIPGLHLTVMPTRHSTE